MSRVQPRTVYYVDGEMFEDERTAVRFEVSSIAHALDQETDRDSFDLDRLDALWHELGEALSRLRLMEVA